MPASTTVAPTKDKWLPIHTISVSTQLGTEKYYDSLADAIFAINHSSQPGLYSYLVLKGETSRRITIYQKNPDCQEPSLLVNVAAAAAACYQGVFGNY